MGWTSLRTCRRLWTRSNGCPYTSYLARKETTCYLQENQKVRRWNLLAFFPPRCVRGDGQAEHDTEARPILVSTSESLVAEVNACLKKRLAVLPTRDTALEAVKKGFAVVCKVRSGEREGDTHTHTQRCLCCLYHAFAAKRGTQHKPKRKLQRIAVTSSLYLPRPNTLVHQWTDYFPWRNSSRH